MSKILSTSIEEGQFASGWLLFPLTAGFIDKKAESDLVPAGDESLVICANKLWNKSFL